jgi:predicted 2-oxoglutarate/Fe(II)-dependent dioxygenase YbiX
MTNSRKNNWFLDISIPSEDPSEWRSILVSKGDLFAPSKVFYNTGREVVSTVSPEQRTSLSLLSDPDVKRIASKIEQHVSDNLALICDHLGMDKFSVGRTEASAVAFLGGGFFGRHQDVTSIFSGERVLSWVYYLTADPLPFTGGDLVLFDGTKEVARVAPHSGRIVVFDSRTMHEVEPVLSESLELKDSRLTITGFVSRRESRQDKLLDFLKRLPPRWIPRSVVRRARLLVKRLTGK